MKNKEKLNGETNRDFALRVIRENIVNLELKPGLMISEQDIADELNLSRTPVHEALQELVRTKIVEVFPQRGSQVCKIDMKMVNEAMFLRKTLELAVVREACEIATVLDYQWLDENVKLQDFYEKSGNLEMIMELDNKFHKKMYQIADRMQCYNVIHEMNVHFDRMRELSLHSGNQKSVIKEHEQLLEYFRNKDYDNLIKLQKAHLERLSLDEKAIREKYSEYFKDE